MGIDKNKATLTFLQDCPVIKDNPLFFNFGNVRNNDCQYITTSNDTALDKRFIDGSKLRRFIFTLATFRSISDNEIVKDDSVDNENVEDLFELQSIIDWVNEQGENEEYPDFGQDMQIEEMVTTTDIPRFDGVDTSVSPALAMYSMTIRIDYIDYTKTIWS